MKKNPLESHFAPHAIVAVAAVIGAVAIGKGAPEPTVPGPAIESVAPMPTVDTIAPPQDPARAEAAKTARLHARQEFKAEHESQQSALEAARVRALAARGQRATERAAKLNNAKQNLHDLRKQNK